MHEPSNEEILGSRNWIVCQIGAREHYAVIRALVRNGVDAMLLTDYWTGSWNFTPGNLSQRFHAEIDGSQVISWNLSYLLFEFKARLMRLREWNLILGRDAWFGKKLAMSIPENHSDPDFPPVIFAYSYGAKDVFSKAKSLGYSTILGQIDPGLFEMKLVAELHRTAGIPFVEPPSSYWVSWHQECELADRIMVNSTWSKTALEKEGIESKKIVIVPLVYETQNDASLRLPVTQLGYFGGFTAERPLNILFLGQVNLRKGILELMEAIRMLASKHVHWTIVGPIEMHLVNELDQLPNTSVIGPVSRNEVRSYYSEADVFILPTHSDGYAITQLEAMSFGLPVIASRYCGEVVVDGINGVLLKEVSPKAIVEAVNYFHDTPENLIRCREAVSTQSIRSIEQLSSDLARLEETLS